MQDLASLPEQNCREEFEHAVFSRRFSASVKRNPNPPKGTGAMDFISEGCPTSEEFLRRHKNTDGTEGDYCDEILSAMWWAWKESRKEKTL